MESATALPPLDADGYLIEPDDWTEHVAVTLARDMEVTLEEDHWDVIRFMRDYFAEHRIIPDSRHVIKHLDRRYPKQGRSRLFEMFPYGYVGQACRIAGMRRPRAWSTG